MSQVKETLKKNTMVIALIVVAVFFTFMTDGAFVIEHNKSDCTERLCCDSCSRYAFVYLNRW